METTNDDQGSDKFEIAEIANTEVSKRAGHTLEELQFRQTYGATINGTRRVEVNITMINPAIQLQECDGLIVVGKA